MQQLAHSGSSAHFKMLPPTVRRNFVIVGLVVSLDRSRQQGREDGSFVRGCYVDDRHHICRRVGEFAEVDVEVDQFVPFRLAQDISCPLPHRIDAPQISCGIHLGIWWGGQGDVGQRGGSKCRSVVRLGDGRGPHRGRSRCPTVPVAIPVQLGIPAVFGALSIEQTHFRRG